MSAHRETPFAPLLGALALGAIALMATSCWVDDHYRCDPTDAGEYAPCEAFQVCTPRGICAYVCGPEHPEGAGDCGASVGSNEVCGPEGYCILATGDGGSDDGGAPDGGAPDGGAPDGGAPDGGAPDGGDTDGGETDGGGSDGGPPETCGDGIQNQDETGVDCGGVCPPCGTETCDDGVRNQDETDVDCGGVCLPCAGSPCDLSTGCSEGSFCLCDGDDCARPVCRSIRRVPFGGSVLRATLSVDPDTSATISGHWAADIVYEYDQNNRRVDAWLAEEQWSTPYLLADATELHADGAFPTLTRDGGDNLQVGYLVGGTSDPFLALQTFDNIWIPTRFCPSTPIGEVARGPRIAHDPVGGNTLASFAGNPNNTVYAGFCDAAETWSPIYTGLVNTPGTPPRTYLTVNPTTGAHHLTHLMDLGGAGGLYYHTDADPAPASQSGNIPAMDIPADLPLAPHTPVAVDGNGEVFVAYRIDNGTIPNQIDLKIAHAHPADTSWSDTRIFGSVDPVLGGTEPGLGVDIEVSANGSLHLAYRDTAWNGVVYARQLQPDTTNFQYYVLGVFEIPPDPTIELELDPDGYPHIIFVGNATDSYPAEYFYIGP
ncbi:MAG: hypothetical protein P1V51_00550 [Deltaproteobacteria bacterium]|nr:hypothetical protein [Deltaproteobacteria bacterium]